MSGIEGEALYALLIGIDHYLPPEHLPPKPGHRGPTYRSLSGCVHDVERMEAFLRQRLDVPASNLRCLIAPDPPRPTLSNPPTYEHLVAAFHWLIETAQPGSQALVHFSGHGGRTPTHFAELKEDDPWDEALVPTDISRASARYLRDVELAFLLSRLVAKGVFVTVVLDCCHAGGALRDEVPRRVSHPRARYNRVTDWRRPSQSLVATEAALVRRWRQMTIRRGRLGRNEDSPTRRWLPGLDRLVLLAACAPHEKAFEFRVSPDQQGGALTHWLLDTFERYGTDLTYRQLYERVHAQIRAFFEVQTPQIEGEVDRLLFLDHGRRRRRAAVMVLAVEADRLLLNTGEAQGVGAGDRFTIFAPGGFEPESNERPWAEVEVSEAGGVESWARYLEPVGHPGPEPGCRARPLQLGSPGQRRTVRLETGASTAAVTALAALEEALRCQNSALLKVVSPGEAPPVEGTDWRVAISQDGDFALFDSTSRPLPHLLPTLPATQRDSARKMADRLLHLARFFHVEALHNPDPHAPVIGVQLSLLPEGYDAEQALGPKIPIGRSTEITAGDWLCLSLANRSRQPLFFTVLDLQPCWEIRQIFPADGDWLVIEGGQEEHLILQAWLPAKLAAATDRLKVFATLDAVRFQWLELPELDEVLSDDVEPERALRSQAAGREWVTMEVAVRIRR